MSNKAFCIFYCVAGLLFKSGTICPALGGKDNLAGFRAVSRNCEKNRGGGMKKQNFFIGILVVISVVALVVRFLLYPELDELTVTCVAMPGVIAILSLYFSDRIRSLSKAILTAAAIINITLALAYFVPIIKSDLSIMYKCMKCCYIISVQGALWLVVFAVATFFKSWRQYSEKLRKKKQSTNR